MPKRLQAAATVLLFLVAVALAGRMASAADAETQAAIEDELRHAETYYWFGMAELGNMGAYEKGLAHLAHVEGLVAKGAFPDEARAAYQARIDALRTDLDEQAEIGHDTLYGVFPLFRFFGPSLFADQANLATFELLDEPEVMVTTSAARHLALESLHGWTYRPQLDAIFVSVPRDTALENEALHVFNSSPKFFVHNLREAVDALPKDQLGPFLAGTTSTQTKNTLLRAFDVPELLVVLVRRIDVVDGDNFYTVEARLYRSDADAPTHKLTVMGFSRDRRDQLLPILLTTLLLLGFAYGAFAWILQRRKKAAVATPWTTYVFLPAVAFLAGRTAPWLIAPLVRRFAPESQNLAIVAFWAPFAAGLALIVLPMLGHWILTSRLARIFPALTFEGRGAAICVAIGAGVVAYMAVPAFLYLESGAVPLLAGLLVAVSLMGAMLGRALDKADRLPAGFAFVAAGLAMAIGAAFMLGSAPWVWGAALLALLPWGWARSAEVEHEEEPNSPPAGPAPAANVPAGLLQRVARPRFQSTPSFRECASRLAPLDDGRTVRLGMVGGPGSGLSATLGALIQHLDARFDDRDHVVIVMRGEARRAESGAAPYEPFRQALAQHFEVDLLGSPRANLRQIDDALGGIFDSFIPFGSILFPDTSGDGEVASRETIFASIEWMLKRLARTKTVILAIDDAQWCDDASLALLAHLLDAFPEGEGEALGILVSSHEADVLEHVGFDPAREIVHVAYPDAEMQTAILGEGVGLSRPTAEQIVERVGSATRSTRGMTWLFQVVADLARAEAFVATESGYAWPDGAWPEDTDLPREMGEILRDTLRDIPQHRQVLMAAACAAEGREFGVDTLAHVLAVPRLDLLAQLDAIEEETGLLHDVRARDDVYAFGSAFVLDVLRRELGVTFSGPSRDDAPQIVREVHARLAAALERELESVPGRIYAVARHYYASGARNAGLALTSCLRASRAHGAAMDFEGAERYLKRAEECATVLGRPGDVAAHHLALACQKAHVSGDAASRVRAASEGDAYLEAHEQAPLWLLRAVAQAHYDAGKSSGDASHAERAIQLGERMIERADSVVEEAMGRHFVGISLPPSKTRRRRAELTRALELLEEEEPGDAEGTRLLGRVLGSLAEELSRGDAEDRQRARRLFGRRLEHLDASGVGDPKGLAMTHGGLGRLAFFALPPRVAEAQQHFEKDLAISQAIGDVEGQVQMHSLLGACALASGDLDQALTHYRASWARGPGVIPRAFSGAGLLRCHAARGEDLELRKVATHVMDMLDGAEIALPTAAVAALAGALQAIEVDPSPREISELADRVRRSS